MMLTSKLMPFRSGGAALAAVMELRARGAIRPEERVVLFNTGAGWLYRG